MDKDLNLCMDVPHDFGNLPKGQFPRKDHPFSTERLPSLGGLIVCHVSLGTDMKGQIRYDFSGHHPYPEIRNKERIHTGVL